MKRILIIIFIIVLGVSAAEAQVNSNSADTIPTYDQLLSKLLNGQLDSNTLIVINGRQAGTFRELKKDLKNIFSADIIQTISPLNREHAKLKYGEKGKAGAIEFLLKDVKIKEVTLSEVYKPEDSVYSSVEIEASFAGGQRAWTNYLIKNLKAETVSDNFGPPGSFTVMVGFIVDKTGEISDIKPLTNHGYGMEEEVVRLISNAPDWVPAINNGRNVRSYRRQPVTFINFLEFELSTYTLVAGKNNTVDIKIDDTKMEDIEAAVSNGTITRGTGNQYIIYVEKPGRVLLTLKKKEKKKILTLGTVALEVK